MGALRCSACFLQAEVPGEPRVAMYLTGSIPGLGAQQPVFPSLGISSSALWFTWVLWELLSPSYGCCPCCLASLLLGTEDPRKRGFSLACREHDWQGKGGP